MKLKHFIDKLQKLDPEMLVIDELWTEDDVYSIREDYFPDAKLSRSDVERIVNQVELDLDGGILMHDLIQNTIEIYLDPTPLLN